MKTSAIACAVLAGVFGFSGTASARDWRGDERGHDRQYERGHDRDYERGQRIEPGYRGGLQPPPNYRRPNERDQRFRADVQRPGRHFREPVYTYSPPGYRAPAHRFYRGGYLPGQYRSNAYYVNDWHAYPGLYAPPYGQQWLNVDGEFLLVALTTGLIVNALLN